ncbi:MAG: protein kinase [Myxococcales bacterium]|nr:protein kinase [Myxococcales bacterium]
MPIGIGDSLGNYKIVSRLGNGGMGAVYLAEHPVIGKRVAVKVIHKDLAASRDVIARFFQEARAVTAIGHEHIVEAHDFGQAPDGEYFYVMEYLQGETLAALMVAQRQVELSRACKIAIQIAGALGAAHERGIMHRDLKPDNVMLIDRRGDRDYVKLLDFGLAKFFDGNTTGLTAVGSVVGTPQYMSPEACQSQKQVDHRTDIYALGVLLFQMVSGRLPFHSPDTATLLRMQVFDPPPLVRAFAPHVPPALERVIACCLAKSPAERFASMRELAAALVPFTMAAARPPSTTMPPPLPTGAGGLSGATLSRAAAPQVRVASPTAISASALESVASERGLVTMTHARRRTTGGEARPSAAPPRRRGRKRVIAGWLFFLLFGGAAGGLFWQLQGLRARNLAAVARPLADPPSANLHVVTQPSGLRTMVDGKEVGRSPLVINAEVGATITLTFEGEQLPAGVNARRIVHVTADQALHLVIAPDISDG